MNRNTAAVAFGAIVLFVVAVVGAIAFTGGDSSPLMTMPDGSTMPTDQMTDTTTTMDDGSTMPDDEMTTESP